MVLFLRPSPTQKGYMMRTEQSCLVLRIESETNLSRTQVKWSPTQWNVLKVTAFLGSQWYVLQLSMKDRRHCIAFDALWSPIKPDCSVSVLYWGWSGLFLGHVQLCKISRYVLSVFMPLPSEWTQLALWIGNLTEQNTIEEKRMMVVRDHGDGVRGRGRNGVFLMVVIDRAVVAYNQNDFPLLLLSNLIWILPNQILVRIKISKNVRWYGHRSVHRYLIGELILSEGDNYLGGVVSNYYSNKQQKIKIWLIMSENKLITTVPK